MERRNATPSAIARFQVLFVMQFNDREIMIPLLIDLPSCRNDISKSSFDVM